MALNNLSYYDDPQSYIIRNAETLAQCKSYLIYFQNKFLFKFLFSIG